MCPVGHGANQSQTYRHSQHAPLFVSVHLGVHSGVVGWNMLIGETSPDSGQAGRPGHFLSLLNFPTIDKIQHWNLLIPVLDLLHRDNPNFKFN